MRKANEESASKSISDTKSKSSSKRTPDLAQLISKSTRDAKRHTAENITLLQEEEEEEGEESGVTIRNFSKKTIFGRI